MLTGILIMAGCCLAVFVIVVLPAAFIDHRGLFETPEERAMIDDSIAAWSVGAKLEMAPDRDAHSYYGWRRYRKAARAEDYRRRGAAAREIAIRAAEDLISKGRD